MHYIIWFELLAQCEISGIHMKRNVSSDTYILSIARAWKMEYSFVRPDTRMNMVSRWNNRRSGRVVFWVKILEGRFSTCISKAEIDNTGPSLETESSWKETLVSWLPSWNWVPRLSFYDTCEYIIFSSDTGGTDSSQSQWKQTFLKIFTQLCFSDVSRELSCSFSI